MPRRRTRVDPSLANAAKSRHVRSGDTYAESMRNPTVVAATLTILLAAGCSGDDSAEQPAGVPASTSSSTTVPTSTGPTTTLAPTTTSPPDRAGVVGELSTQPRQSDGFLSVGQPTALLVAVRQASQPGFQRVVLEFAGDTAPQYRIGYQTPPVRQPGSGFPVDIPGSAVLQIHAEPASQVDMSQQDFPPTYDGPLQIPMQGPGAATALVFVGDFEANLYWAVGLTRESPFAVGVLSNPTRLVIDIATD
jgi:hypothetical protein